MNNPTGTPRNIMVPSDLKRFLCGGLNKTWAIAGGMGGLGGAALVLGLQAVFGLNPLIGVSATVGIIFTLLVIGFKQQLDRLLQENDEAVKRINDLQHRLSNVPQVMDQGILEINEMLLRLAATCDNFKSFVEQAENVLILELPKILPIKRVGWYIPDPNAKFQDTENSPAPLTFKAQDSPGFQSDKTIMRTDVSFCLEMLKRQQPIVLIEKRSSAFISITDRDDPHRIWGVLFIHSQELRHVEKQIREKIVPKLQQGFRLVWDRQKNLEERVARSEIKHKHVCGVLLSDLQIDEEFPLSKDDKTYLLKIVKDNALEIEKAFISSQEITIHRESYCISLIPLDEGERRDVLISVDTVAEGKLAEDRSRWTSMNNLVRYLARSRIGEQILTTKRYFNKRLARMVSDPDTVQRIALVAILLHDLHKFASSPLLRSRAIQVAEKVIARWKSLFDPKLAEATKYDDQTFLMCVPTEKAETTRALAKTIRDNLQTELSKELELKRFPRIFVGVAFSAHQLQDCNDLVMAALSAIEDSRTADHEVGMKTVGTETSG